MGLDTSASHIVWFIATAAMVVSATGSFFAVGEELDDARATRAELVAERFILRPAEATWCHLPAAEQLRVSVTNVGERGSTAGLTFLLDGAAVTAYNVSVATAGSSVVWASGESAAFTLGGVASPPSEVALVTSSGMLVRTTLRPCPVFTTIVLTPASATLDPSDTQIFSAQGYDQYGDLYDAAPFSWSTDAGSIVALNDTHARLTAGTTAGTGYVVEATSGAVTGQAAVTVRNLVHVDSITTYESGAATSSFNKRETVETRVVIKDHNGDIVQGATVTIELVDPQTTVQYTDSAVTSASGIAYFNYTLPNNARQGTWTDRVTDVSGTNMVYDSISNVVTEITFTV